MQPCPPIAVAQTCPKPGMIVANVEEHVFLARLAATEGARLILFPELSLTGYELELGPKLAIEVEDVRLRPLCEAAAEGNIIIIAGAPVRVGDSLHIGALIFHPDRRIELYTKHHLGTFPPGAAVDSVEGHVPPSEKVSFQPGTHDPLISLGDQRAAIAICADIGQPTHPKNAAERGATVYLASMFVIPSDFAGESAALSSYAAKYDMLTALANYGSPTGGLRSAGQSSIWSARGELLMQLPDEGRCIAIYRETELGYQAKTLFLEDGKIAVGTAQIRLATEKDLPAIVDIYNQSIPGGWSTADTRPVTVAERVMWFRKFNRKTRPIWVFQIQQKILGVAYLSSFYGGRPAYDETAEVSIYVATDAQRSGIGTQLKKWVIEQCPRLGVTTLLSMHFDHNQATPRINERLGFERMGHLTEIATVHGQKRGLVMWALRIPAAGGR
jgi:L-amino acid N-acyltransferase YncA/predicted amidohydrolase